MKISLKICLLVILLSNNLFSQLNSPNIKCIEVLANGDCKLTWIPPADPTSIFQSIDVYSSINQFSGYTKVGTVGSNLITSYTHNGAGANVQSKFYYLVTNATGSLSSSSSDTLKSIFLNILPVSQAINVVYNPIKLPKLNSTATTYTVSKEYPLGIWNMFAITPNQNYFDTISVCSASVNYVVSIADNSGCVSTSNINGGIFNDIKEPNEVEIDSISVLPNGQTIISWHIPYDKDVVKYRIYRGQNGIVTAIDSVMGRLNTSYVYTTTAANNGAVELFNSAVDSCNNIGVFTNTPPYTTIYLKTTYDSCAYSTNLTWNAYNKMPGGLLEYKIYYSVNSGAYNYIGSTTETNFTHSNTMPDANVCYFVRAINKLKTITSSSNRVCFFTNQITAPAFVYIQTASVIDKTTIEVKVFADTTKRFTSIDLLRSEDGINFTFVSNQAFNGTPYYVFTDADVATKEHYYYYKAIIKDACGNDRTYSQKSKTILLTVKEIDETFFTKQLTWNHYKGFDGGISGYKIYRIINDDPNPIVHVYKGPADSSYIDNVQEEAPNGSKIEYRVEAIEGISNQYGFLELSKSNKRDIYQEDDLFVPNAFSPKGINKTWLPITHFIDKNEYKVTVFDRWGKVIFYTTDNTQAWTGDNLPGGIYVYLIQYKNSRGEYKENKGTVLLIE